MSNYTQGINQLEAKLDREENYDSGFLVGVLIGLGISAVMTAVYVVKPWYRIYKYFTDETDDL